SVTVPSGETEMTFSASTHPVATDTTVIVTASAGACKVTRSVIVKAPVLRSLSVQTVIRGGGRGKITVCLTGATASGGAAVSLNSNRPSVLPVPSSVTIPTGKACLSIALNAATVRSDVPVTISARRVVKLSRPTIVRNFTTATPTPTQPSTPHDTPTNTPIDSPTSTAIDTPTNTPINTQTSTPTDTPTTTATTIASCGSGGPCTVFVTSTTHDGNLGGIAGGDNICQIRASAAGLPGSFRAWLSATGTDASSRFDASAGPYYLVNGTTIATDISDLIDGTLAAAIDCTESGNLFQTPVWTATQDDGSFSGQTCSNVGELPDWSTITGRTAVGSSMTTTTGWSFTSIQPCASSYALYCFQVE
ncbi:MAG TPA: hypothetical protein PK819_07005, partial [Thermomicrobiales bacterium]|nr:hypothetical protein [Thermomicrobiales bacterium]